MAQEKGADAECVDLLRKASDYLKDLFEYRKVAEFGDFENWYRGDTKLDLPRLLREIEATINLFN